MKAIVIGAGAGGMAVANLLAKSGYQVDVFEKNNHLGGRMGVLHQDGFRFDTGPSWYLMPEVFEHYFSLLGSKPSDFYKLKRLSPAYKVFYDYADPITVHGDLGKDRANFETIEPGTAVVLDKYVAESKNIYQLALKYFLYNPFRSLGPVLASKEVARNSLKLAGGLGGSLHSYVSKRFATKQLQQIMEYAMVFLGTSPFDAPSLYRLMSYLDFEQGVFFPEKGMHSVTEALQKIGVKLGVNYHLNSDVEAIEVDGRRTTGIRANGKTYMADIVVSGADLAFTETKLLPASHQSYPASYWAKKNPAPSALLLYLGVKGDLPELEHHNLIFVSDWKKNFDDIYKSQQWPGSASMYLSRTTATDSSTAPTGHENIFVLVPLPAGKELASAEQKKLVDRYIDQIADVCKLPDLKQRIVSQSVRGPAHFDEAFNSWQSSALGLSHTLLQSAFLRPNIRSKKLDNLYYVGALTQPGIGVPMCLISAELVIKSLVNEKTPGPLNNLPDLR